MAVKCLVRLQSCQLPRMWGLCSVRPLQGAKANTESALCLSAHLDDACMRQALLVERTRQAGKGKAGALQQAAILVNCAEEHSCQLVCRPRPA